MRLEAEKLGFGYREDFVVRDVCLALRVGEILGVVGPNGSGKSTLVRLVNRLLAPRVGRVAVDGEDLAGWGRRSLARLMAYVPQTESAPGAMSVLDAVLTGRRPHTAWRLAAADMDKALAALEELDLVDYAGRAFGDLSGGEQQRVLLARALAQETPLLILDEPTSNLDVRHQLQVMETVRGLADGGRLAVLMVVHDLNLAARFADRLLLLKEGRVLAQGAPREVLTPDGVAEAFGIRASVFEHEGRLVVVPLGRL